MRKPDFARTDVGALTQGDLRFLVENFPRGGRSYEEIADVIHALPTTLESMLDSAYVVDRILRSRDLLLDISPFLLFNVLLRQVGAERRSRLDRAVVNYLANLLCIFVRADRVHRVTPDEEQSYQYVAELVEESMHADDRRRFIVQAHVGNYSLYLTGLYSRWLAHRRRYGKATVSPGYYADMGRSAFHQAASHTLADEYRLRDVFLRLALSFDHYRTLLNTLSSQYLR